LEPSINVSYQSFSVYVENEHVEAIVVSDHIMKLLRFDAAAQIDLGVLRR
jgi:hypothetical protein